MIAAIILYFQMHALTFSKMLFINRRLILSFLGKRGVSLAGFLITFIYVHSFHFLILNIILILVRFAACSNFDK